MIAFVTGGTGFVGGHLCERLRRDGWTVRALVRSRNRAKLLIASECVLVRGDVADRAEMARAMKGADLIVHLAGLTKTPNPSDFFTVNGEGTATVALAALDAKFKGRFIHVSSQAAVGPAIDGRPRNETDPAAPVSNYGRSKMLGERRLREVGTSLQATVLRPGAIYGPRELDIFEQIRAVARTGLALVPGKPFDIQLTHVDDIVEAIILAAQEPQTAGRDYMVTDPAIWSCQQVAEAMGAGLGRRVRSLSIPMPVARIVGAGNDALSKVLGRSVSALTGDKVRELSHAPWLASSSRLTVDSGWKPKWELRSGLESTIKWYREKGWL